MSHKTLRRKITLWIMLPLVLGIMVTAVVSWLPIYLQYPTWIESLTRDMVSDQGKVLTNLSTFSGSVGQCILQMSVDLVLLINQFEQAYFAKEVHIKDQFDDSQNFVNGKLEAEGVVIPFGWDPVNNQSFTCSEWYLGPNDTDPSHLASASRAHLTDFAVFDFVARPSVSYPNSSMPKMYHVSASDGLFYVAPTVMKPFFLEYTDPNCTASYYDPRCRPWYHTVEESKNHTLAILTDPYLATNMHTIKQTVCKGIWTLSTLDMVTCIDFNIDSVLFAAFELQNSNLTYMFALDKEGDVYAHPKMNLSSGQVQTIAELEFPNASQSEIAYFQQEVEPLFTSGTRALTSYMRDGIKMWIAISPVFSVLSTDMSETFIFSVGVVTPESALNQRPNDLKKNCSSILVGEVAIFFGVLAGIIIIGYILSRHIAISIVKPIDDLANILDRMNDGDLQVNINLNFREVSSEISQLYKVFSKLKIVLRFSRGNLSKDNEAEALMNYAQAMKLFEEFRNNKGMGICAANIADIHFRSNRHEEALGYYHQALNLAVEVRDASTDAQAKKNNEKAVFERMQLLAMALLHSSDLTPRKLWDQAIDLLLAISRKYEESGDEARMVSTLLDLSMTYVKWGKLNLAKENVLDASTRIMKAGNWTLPPEILRERAMFTEGLILELEGREFEAAHLYTHCIELNEHYDPVVRKDCLLHLQSIFTKHNLDCTQVIDLLTEFKVTHRDLVFVLDYSASMAGLRIHRTMANISRLFERAVQPKDRFAFLAVNRIPRTVFNLTEKGKNTGFLISQILRWNEPRGGTAFYDGIRCALKQFDVEEIDIEEDSELLGEVRSPKPARSKWILALFDGEDNCSRVSYKKLKKKLSGSGVNLVIIGLGLSHDGMMLAKGLSDATPKGLYLESSSIQDLDDAFNALWRWIESPNMAVMRTSLFTLREEEARKT